MPRVVHFDFQADDPERASAFFKQALGWTFEKWSGEQMEYWLVMTGDRDTMGIDGGMSRRTPETPAITNTIHVEDIDAAMASIEQAGGKIVMPKMNLPGVGQMANFEDTEGNVWGLIQFEEGAMV